MDTDGTGELGRRRFIAGAAVGALALTQPDTARAGVAGSQLTTAAFSCWDKVFPTSEFSESPAWSLTCAAGETVHLQIALRSSVAVDGVQVQAEDLVGSGGMPAVGRSRVMLRKVSTITVTGEGPHPDILEAPPVPAGGPAPDPPPLPIDLDPDVTAVVWVSVSVPASTAPGMREGPVTVRDGDGNPVATVQLSLTVLNFSLPEPGLLTISQLQPGDIVGPNGWDLDALARSQAWWFGEAHDDLDGWFGDYYLDVSMHRGTGTNAMRGIKASDPGVPVTLNTAAHDTLAANVLGRLQLRYWPFTGLFPTLLGGELNPDGVTRGFGTDCRWEGIPVFTGESSSELTPHFVSELTARASAIAQHLAANGWLDRCYVIVADELNTSVTLNRERAIAIFSAIKAADPRIRIRLTACPHAGLFGLVDLWVVHADHYAWGTANEPDGKNRVRAALAADETVLLYHNTSALPGEQDWARTRMLPWMLWKEGEVNSAEGRSRFAGTLSWWQVNNWDSADPWSTAAPTAPGRVSRMLYPPRPNTGSGPLDSIRWELFSRAQQEAQRLSMLRELVDQAPASAERATAEQVLADAMDPQMLENFPRVMNMAQDPEIYQDTFPREAAWYDDLMARAGGSIEALLAV